VEEIILMWARGGKDACEITKLIRPKYPTIKCADVRAVMARAGFACHMCGDDEELDYKDNPVGFMTEVLGVDVTKEQRELINGMDDETMEFMLKETSPNEKVSNTHTPVKTDEPETIIELPSQKKRSNTRR
jgi:hypothetical protein